MRVLDLFAGIGGFSLGLERAGMQAVAFCEIDPFCRAILAERWPGRPIYPDIRELTGAHLAADRVAVDLVAGGFPCQDISVAGKGDGVDASGLWTEQARIIGELRPSVALVENVAALLVRGIDRVLGDLAALGYDAEWHCIPASAVGAPHQRDRVWIIGHRPGGAGAVADTASERMERHRPARQQEPLLPLAAEVSRRDRARGRTDQWEIEPDVGRVAHGVPHRVDRMRALGNAIVPQVAEVIGRAILAERARRRPPAE